MTDLAHFWEEPAEFDRENYIGAPPTAEMISSVESELGYKLPGSYIELMHSQNGGRPFNNLCATSEPTSWANDHIAITGIFGIGREKIYSLCGTAGSQFMIDMWEYPPLGVYVANCPSAGHDMVALDYRACGPTGEPRVVHVDQERDFHITVLAPDFASFIANLKPADAFGDEE